MSRVVAKSRAATEKATLAAAKFAGSLMRTIPGAGGALLLCFGFGEIYRPLTFITAGAFLLLLDRRVS